MSRPYLNVYKQGPRPRRIRRPKPIQPPGTYPGYPPVTFPPVPKEPPPFAPFTPIFEELQRGVQDNLAGVMSRIRGAGAQIGPQVDLMRSRLATQKDYQTQRLNEEMAERGLYESGIRPQLYQRDIYIPYERALQDLALEASRARAGLAEEAGAAQLEASQGMMDAYMQNIQSLMEMMPLMVPQFYSPWIMGGGFYGSGPGGLPIRRGGGRGGGRGSGRGGGRRIRR